MPFSNTLHIFYLPYASLLVQRPEVQIVTAHPRNIVWVSVWKTRWRVDEKVIRSTGVVLLFRDIVVDSMGQVRNYNG